MKKFKEGEYYIFDANIKKIGKATIHGFVEVNGTKYAVVSYRDNNNVPYIKVQPVCELNGRMAIFLLDAVFIYVFADAPVLHKPVKFKVGKTYFNKSRKYTVTAKYTSPKGRTYLIFEDIYVLEVRTNEYNVEYVEFSNANADADGEGARFDACYVYQL